MAKGKSLNPAESFRKAERKKELKKNKTERQKARDLALVKKDTTSMEEDIERLKKAEQDDVISAAQKSQLASLRSELERINKKKEEYVTEHPEHKKLVYRSRYKKAEDGSMQEGEDDIGSKKKDRKVFDKNGLPRHPERSIYFDPVMNPYGVPPPGMPYMERPLRPDEVDSQAEESSEEDDLDDDIVMPAGPPPGAKRNGNDDTEGDELDDDIPMPDGPPPQKVPLNPPLPPGLPPPITTPNYYPSGLPPMAYPPNIPLPLPPPGFGPLPFSNIPTIDTTAPMAYTSAPRPPPYAPNLSTLPMQSQPTHPLPPKPTSGPSTSNPSDPTISAAATTSTISAPAQLRDLKKESTAFLPSSLKRKKTGASGASSSANKRIDAAPETNERGGRGQVAEDSTRPDLLETLAGNFPRPSQRVATEPTEKKQNLEVAAVDAKNDDYEKFMQEVGGIL